MVRYSFNLRKIFYECSFQIQVPALFASFRKGLFQLSHFAAGLNIWGGRLFEHACILKKSARTAGGHDLNDFLNRRTENHIRNLDCRTCFVYYRQTPSVSDPITVRRSFVTHFIFKLSSGIRTRVERCWIWISHIKALKLRLSRRISVIRFSAFIQCRHRDAVAGGEI